MNTQNEKAIAQNEQQPVSNEIIYNELQKLNENLKSISNSLQNLCTYGIYAK